MLSPEQKSNRLRWLYAGTVLLGIAIIVLSVYIMTPVIQAETAPHSVAVDLPPYNLSAWSALPVQNENRCKPFESACIDSLRTITGRTKFEKQPALAIVLQWMMIEGGSVADPYTNWEEYPFILCDHHGLRHEIYKHLEEKGVPRSEAQKPHGKFSSPSDLRHSPGLKVLLTQAKAIELQDPQKAQQKMTPEQRNAEEVMRRLVLFDSICQNSAIIQANRGQRHDDPMAFVALDRIPGSGWFSFTELRQFQQEPAKWEDTMLRRLSIKPHLYLDPEMLKKLEHFQQLIEEKKGSQVHQQLTQLLRERDDKALAQLEKQFGDPMSKVKLEQVVEAPQVREQLQALATWIQAHKQDDAVPVSGLLAQLRAIYADRHQHFLAAVDRDVEFAVSNRYHPKDPRFHMLHLKIIEGLDPEIYVKSKSWQKYPKEDAERALASFSNVKKAYRQGDPGKFEQASQEFFELLREQGDRTLVEGIARNAPAPVLASYQDYRKALEAKDPGRINEALNGVFAAADQAGDKILRYPGSDAIGLEMSFNRMQPFMYAWIILLGAVACFAAAYATDSKVCYWLGFAFYFVSLGFQIFGFYARVAISGRPPVTNMYETVIWVAAMSSIFALVLELIYRKKIIALGGALVATFGLILADQFSLVLDPKISPLVPVLRSNFWLIIHVLTIVSSYAGGTLAWALANITLLLLAFGRPGPELVKTLSNYTYRAMQIAVLLLAAGTFLGGWWAAYSWGRFWGWDAKEVGALIALVCYVIPLHARFIGWVKDFGLAVAAVICYAAIISSWYGTNFVWSAGLHSYGFGGGGPWWVFWAALLNIEWVLVASILYTRKLEVLPADGPPPDMHDGPLAPA